MAIDLPLDQGAYGIHVVPEGWEAPAEQSRLYVDINMVSAGYMATLEIPVLAGREFDARDREGAEPVAVVNRTFVDEVWPGRSAVGRRVLWTDGPDIGLTVVGVVEDVHNQVLTERPGPQLYRPLAQVTRSDTHLLVRTRLSETQVVRLVHEGLRALDPHLALSTIVPLDRYTAVGVLPQRIAAFFSTGLGFLALLLSGMGVYGVMANTVSRRAREMGIRMALGADSGKVLRLVLRGAFCLALPGLGIGAVTAGGVAVLLRTLLLGISPLDPAAVISVTFVISVTVVASTLVPALRAARTNATVLLRNE